MLITVYNGMKIILFLFRLILYIWCEVYLLFLSGTWCCIFILKTTTVKTITQINDTTSKTTKTAITITLPSLLSVSLFLVHILPFRSSSCGDLTVIYQSI